jgi:thiosulfate dehydrogenase [quinone] large subunit
MAASARGLLVPLAVGAAVVLFYLVNPWFAPESGSTLNTAATVLFWVLALAVVVLMIVDSRDPEAPDVEIASPRFARYLFGNTRAGLFWLPIRIFVGFEWVTAGWHKMADGGWIDGGASLLAYWERAVAIPEEGRPPISFEWYRTFIQWLIDNGAENWMGWVITFGEIAVGLGLLFGALTGIAAFFGSLMNMSFMLAGSASTNPILFTFAIGLILAWKVAGYYGLDRWLLPALGVPWSRRSQVSEPPGVAAASG